MIAVIKTGAKQYQVAPKDIIQIEKLAGNEGDMVEFDQVLMISDEKGKDVKVGTPTVSGAKVVGKIVKQTRAKKVEGIKYKSKVRYSKKLGHKQYVSKVEITEIKA